jgi:uncharacterized cupin superfamily protein
VHENDVWLHVLEGEMHARVGNEIVKATAGCWVMKPRLIPHTMWNAGSKPARITELYTPGGFEHFFKDSGIGCAKARSDSMSSIASERLTVSASSTTRFPS